MPSSPSVPVFRALDTESGLSELNSYLSSWSYLSGFRPSSADFSLLSSSRLAARVDHNKFPHVQRWLSHIEAIASTKEAEWRHFGPSGQEKPKEEEDDDDDDFMTSLSDDEDEEEGNNAAQALMAKKNAEREAAKRASKGGPQAKSSIILDIKPNEAEQDMDELLAQVKAIQMEGLTWGGSEFLPVAYGVNKIRIICVVVDDICSVDDLTENIEELDAVQSVDIHAFNKL